MTPEVLCSNYPNRDPLTLTLLNSRPWQIVSWVFLSPEIYREVLALQPLSLVQAVALARLQEDKLTNAQRSSHP